MSYKLNTIVRHGLQTRASNRDSAIVGSYSVIVTDHGRTGRDLSLRIYTHERAMQL
ncbi:MAG TPA: hypothetical protein VIG72_09505 [Pontibacter sp.]